MLARIKNALHPQTHPVLPADVAGLDPGIVFDALRNQRRRHILDYLQQTGPGETVTLRELANYVATEEHDKPFYKVTSKERKAVYVALYQQHLTALEDDGFIEYENRGRDDVALTERGLAAWRVLDDVRETLDGGDA